MNQSNELNDEIDLRDLFFTLLDSKIFIILISIISVFLASFYLQSAERKFSVEYNVKPVGETKNSPSFSGLGGFASLAGIQLPTSSGNDFNIFKELITAPEVSEISLKIKKLLERYLDLNGMRHLIIIQDHQKVKYRFFLVMLRNY